jgi:SAM-dependent methyltransferase
MAEDRKAHWDAVYEHKAEGQLSWHQDEAGVSLDLAKLAGVTAGSSAIDIGGGTSPFAEALVGLGLTDISVLDISQVALEKAHVRLGSAGNAITWIAADITSWTPGRHFDLWHDRAVFHFLVNASDRAAYLDCLAKAAGIGGHAIIATFAPDGPETCSGLPVARYSPEDLASVLGPAFDLVAHRHHLHHTPWNKPQSFQFSLFRRSR